MITTLAAVAGLVIGFVGGLCAYRSSRRWCGGCGASLSCWTCAGPPTGAHGGPAGPDRVAARPAGRRRNAGPVRA